LTASGKEKPLPTDTRDAFGPLLERLQSDMRALRAELADLKGAVVAEQAAQRAFMAGRLAEHELVIRTYVGARAGETENRSEARAMTLPDIVKTAVRQSFGEALGAEIGDLVVKETRGALQEREADLTKLARKAVREALADLMAGRE
jgi:hypothetical protein